MAKKMQLLVGPVHTFEDEYRSTLRQTAGEPRRGGCIASREDLDSCGRIRSESLFTSFIQNVSSCVCCSVLGLCY
ncbi:hypothetical protein Y032_0009g644 [Ancylostoma ceylanicum]|uniref:Uncharacterized protein n=1 Tax=Ancylostoma ceylanicum TaxID=53326 RepID=A0A016VJU1_9BILA|nr:hypothetical protein Y032_0009g644 [Ancylostoma ceylanicum]